LVGSLKREEEGWVKLKTGNEQADNYACLSVACVLTNFSTGIEEVKS